MALKLIFLDIDGVLNNQNWFQSDEYKNLIDNGDVFVRQFCPDSVKLLNRLTDETQAKIVISSSWRSLKNFDRLINILKTNGITGSIIDRTPILSFSPYDDYDYSVPRGCEIKAWMEINKDKLGVGIGKYKSYVIFDDDSDMLYWQRNNFLQTNPQYGLTSNLIQKAKKILL
jgi:hypothetical protein